MAGLSREDFIARVETTIVRRLAVELLKKQLDEQTDPDAMDDCPMCQALVDNLLAGGSDDYAVRITLRRPIVGLGAPVHCYLPQAARLLGTEPLILPDADVANAIGAVTSSVVVTRQARIRPNEVGEYAIIGLPDARTFDSFDDAQRHATGELEKLVQAQAARAGTSARAVETTDEDKMAAAADGSPLFLERVITVRLVGPPDAVDAAVGSE